MHLIATNLCEWLFALVEETKHEIVHLSHSHHSDSHMDSHHNSTSSEQPETTLECESNIMGSLVANSSPFLFPCTIEYSLICAVILYEMWKKVKSIPAINKGRKVSEKSHSEQHLHKSAYHLSIDCSKAHQGVFGGVVIMVLTIIVLIVYSVLHKQEDYYSISIKEVTYYEIFLYTCCTFAVLFLSLIHI